MENFINTDIISDFIIELIQYADEKDIKTFIKYSKLKRRITEIIETFQKAFPDWFFTDSPKILKTNILNGVFSGFSPCVFYLY